MGKKSYKRGEIFASNIPDKGLVSCVYVGVCVCVCVCNPHNLAVKKIQLENRQGHKQIFHQRRYLLTDGK